MARAEAAAEQQTVRMKSISSSASPGSLRFTDPDLGFQQLGRRCLAVGAMVHDVGESHGSQKQGLETND